jgi:hypothetical protein
VTAKALAVASDPALEFGAPVVIGLMPTPDFPPRKLRRDVGGRSFTPGFDALLKSPFLRRRKGRRGLDPDEGGVPVEPNRPNTLSGGAAAALDFEKD